MKMGIKSKMQLRADKARQTHVINSRLNKLAVESLVKIQGQVYRKNVAPWTKVVRFDNIYEIVNKFEHEKLMLLTKE